VTAPSRATVAGHAYLDLRRKARQDRRPVDELIQLYELREPGGPAWTRRGSWRWPVPGSRCCTSPRPRWRRPRTTPTWACSAAGLPAAIPARVSRNWPPPPPASCSKPPPGGSAARRPARTPWSPRTGSGQRSSRRGPAHPGRRWRPVPARTQEPRQGHPVRRRPRPLPGPAGLA